MPLAFGAVEAWSEAVVLAASSGLFFCLALHAWRNRGSGGLRWTPALLPMGLFVILALIQVAPLPLGLLSVVSPHAHGIYLALRDDSLSPTPLSLYPHATWHDLRLVLMASAVFLSVLQFFRRTAAILQLLAAIAIIGAGLTVLAFLQDFFGNGQFYWIGPQIAQVNSGTFACHNHFSQHMVLSIMAMLAWAMVRVYQVLGRQWFGRGFFSDFYTDPELRAARWMLVFAVLGLVAVAMSASRMGVVSAGAGILVFCLILSVRLGRRGSSLPLMVGLAAVCAVVLAGFEMLAERMATLKSLDIYVGRWTVVTDLLPAIGHFFLTGSGLGTFSAVYPMYDTGRVWQFASHAENEYAQLLLEMGIPGAILVAWFVVVVGRAGIRVISRLDQPIFIAAPALLAGLLAVMIHSWTDFGQHLPAIAALSAVFCALLVVMGQRADQASSAGSTYVLTPSSDNPATRPSGSPGTIVPPDADLAQSANAEPLGSGIAPPGSDLLCKTCSLRTGEPRRARWFPQALLALLLLLALINLPSAINQVFAEATDLSARALVPDLEVRGIRATQQEYAHLVQLGQRAVDLDPTDAMYRYRLGVYRWYAAVRGRTKEQIGPDVTPELRDAAESIIVEMIFAAARCPTLGAVHCWRGQMEWWVLGDAAGRERVENGIRTARHDPVAWYAAAQLAAADGQPDLAYQRLERMTQVKKSSFPKAIPILAIDCARPDLAVKLAGDDPQRLSDASDWLARNGFTAQAMDARGRAIIEYRRLADDTQLSATALAMLAQASESDGDHVSAVAFYRRALSKEYRRTNWRLACAESLTALGRYDEALGDLATCERQKADLKTITTLRVRIEALRVVAATRPATTQSSSSLAAGEDPANHSGAQATDGWHVLRGISDYLRAAIFALASVLLFRAAGTIRKARDLGRTSDSPQVWWVLAGIFMLFALNKGANILNIAGILVRDAAKAEGLYDDRQALQYVLLAGTSLAALVGIAWLFPHRRSARRHWGLFLCAGVIALFGTTRFVSLHAVDAWMNDISWLPLASEVVSSTIVIVIAYRRNAELASVTAAPRHHQSHDRPNRHGGPKRPDR